MTLKKLHEKRHLFSVQRNSKPRLRRCKLKHVIGNEFINLLTELRLNLTEGNFQIPEVVKQRTKQHCSLVLVQACKKG